MSQKSPSHSSKVSETSAEKMRNLGRAIHKWGLTTRDPSGNSEEKRRKRAEHRKHVFHYLEEIKESQKDLTNEMVQELHNNLENDKTSAEEGCETILSTFESIGLPLRDVLMEIEASENKDFGLIPPEINLANPNSGTASEISLAKPNPDTTSITEGELRVDDKGKKAFEIARSVKLFEQSGQIEEEQKVTETNPMHKEAVHNLQDLHRFSTAVFQEKFSSNPDARFKSIIYTLITFFTAAQPQNFPNFVQQEIAKKKNVDLLHYYNYLKDDNRNQKSFNLKNIVNSSYNGLAFKRSSLLRLSICQKQLFNIFMKIFRDHFVQKRTWKIDLQLGVLNPPHVAFNLNSVQIWGEGLGPKKGPTSNQTVPGPFIDAIKVDFSPSIKNRLMELYECPNYNATNYAKEFTELNNLSYIPLLRSSYFTTSVSEEPAFAIFKRENNIDFTCDPKNFQESVLKDYQSGRGVVVTTITTNVYHHNTPSLPTNSKLSFCYDLIDSNGKFKAHLYEDIQTQILERQTSRATNITSEFDFAKHQSNSHDLISKYSTGEHLFIPEVSLVISNLTEKDNLQITTNITTHSAEPNILGLYLLISSLEPILKRSLENNRDAFLKSAQDANVFTKASDMLNQIEE